MNETSIEQEIEMFREKAESLRKPYREIYLAIYDALVRAATILNETQEYRNLRDLIDKYERLSSVRDLLAFIVEHFSLLLTVDEHAIIEFVRSQILDRLVEYRNFIFK